MKYVKFRAILIVHYTRPEKNRDEGEKKNTNRFVEDLKLEFFTIL